jgi:hypothetical protein
MALMTVSTDDDFETRQHIQDPLGRVSREEALRLCKMFAEETNIMYPFLDMEKVICHVEGLRTSDDATGSWMISGDDKDVIALVLAISLMRGRAGESELSRSLFHSIKNRLERRTWAPISVTGINVVVLAVSSFVLYTPEDILSESL